MDNPQHYQPLSHALHPPSSSVNRTHSNHYTPTGHAISYAQPQPQKLTNQAALQQEEEEEEEEEDDDDEGLVEEQLHQSDADAAGSDVESPKPSSSVPVQNSNALVPQEEEPSPAPEQKRRPGRPRGSKNRRPRIGSAKHETQFYYQSQNTSQTTATPSGPPTHPNITPQNQQYYEFQWRVLNLCAEFYGAAEELVKGISPLVIAQCYHMGPNAKVDPLTLLADAKRICDTLLANPSQLVSNPPPPIYPVLPTLRHTSTSAATIPTASTSTTPASTSASAPQPSVITNPQSFVVPLGAQPPYPQYPMYPPQGHYPTTPYYQYTPYGQPAYYGPPPVVPALPPSAPSTSVAPTPQPTATITTTPATGGTVIGNQGAWSEEETERLKKLAEESKSKGTSGEIEWEWLIGQWGISRTRHQILIKATALGLKESSTRGVKRRRGDEGAGDTPAAMASLQPSAASSATSGVMPSTSSPAHSASQPGSTPAASPAMQHQQRPTSSKGHSSMPTTAAPKLPWPMPTVAVNTVSPVVTASSSAHEQQQQQQRSSYYRPRPNQADSSGKSTTMAQPPTTHQFSMYAPNGMRKENGK